MYYPSPSRNIKSKPKIIKVSGEGNVAVNPDMAEVRLGVSKESRALAKAQEENTKIIFDIKNALKQSGIYESDIQTSDFSIHPQYDYVDGRQVFRNYRVDHMLVIKVKEIERAGAIVDISVRNGANVVSGVNFETTGYEEFYRKALSLAVLDARKKAESIAETLGVQLAKVPLSITEISGDDIIPYQTKVFAASEAATSFQPGMLEVASRINAEFTYVLV